MKAMKAYVEKMDDGEEAKGGEKKGYISPPHEYGLIQYVSARALCAELLSGQNALCCYEKKETKYVILIRNSIFGLLKIRVF